MNTILDPKFLGPFNPNWGYFVYDPENGEVTAICFEGIEWSWSTWIVIGSGSSYY